MIQPKTAREWIEILNELVLDEIVAIPFIYTKEAVEETAQFLNGDEDFVLTDAEWKRLATDFEQNERFNEDSAATLADLINDLTVVRIVADLVNAKEGK